MRLAIVNLTGGSFSGGYRKYLTHMIPLLAADPRVSKVLVVMPPGSPPAVEAPAEILSWVPDDGRRAYRVLRKSVRNFAPDVVFIPTARWLNFGPVPTVVMVRNMEPLIMPLSGLPLREAMRNVARALFARQACINSTGIIAVSRYVREFLIGRWRVDKQKVAVVYHGVEPPLDAMRISKPRAVPDSRFNFLFTAGSIRPARGLEDILWAFSLVAPQYPEMALVIAGKPDPGTESYLRRMQALACYPRVQQRVHWTGQLTREEMAWCFRQCEAFVVTSRAEACPNTALEALSYGCAVVSTDQPPMPEFFDTVALYYRAGDPANLASQLGRYLSSHSSEVEVRKAAAQRAQEFTWQRAADLTLQYMHAVLNSLERRSRRA